MEPKQPPQAPPSAKSLLWMFARWAPSVALVTLLTLWALVGMGGIARVVGWLFIMYLAPGLGVLIAVVVTVYAVARRRISRPIVSAWLLSAVVIWPSFWERGWLALPYPSSLEDSPVSVRPPTNERMVVYWGGPELERNYHALFPDQRWAFDLVVPPAGRAGDQLKDYGCFGVEVVAPASGVVAMAHDGEPDAKPGRIQETAQPMGNHVVIELKGGTYLVLAHLKRGSVKVKAGDVLVEGQPIGACGNSGRTSEPHVHIHHQRQKPNPSQPGLAEGLPLFFRSHTGPKMPSGGARPEGDKLILLGDTIQAKQTGD